MGSFSFPKNKRVLNHKDFVNLNRLGKRRHSANFTLIIGKNRLGTTRLGIAVRKKTGNAVKRNRVKRLIREFFRLHQYNIPQGYDMVIAAKLDASGLNFWEIKEELNELVFDKKF